MVLLLLDDTICYLLMRVGLKRMIDVNLLSFFAPRCRFVVVLSGNELEVLSLSFTGS